MGGLRGLGVDGVVGRGEVLEGMNAFDEFTHSEVGDVDKVFVVASLKVQLGAFDDGLDVFVDGFVGMVEGTVTEVPHGHTVTSEGFELMGPLGRTDGCVIRLWESGESSAYFESFTEILVVGLDHRCKGLADQSEIRQAGCR